MNAAAAQVLDLLSQRMINVDEAIRIIEAIRNPAVRQLMVKNTVPNMNGPDSLMEAFSAAPQPQFCYGNIIK